MVEQEIAQLLPAQRKRRPAGSGDRQEQDDDPFDCETGYGQRAITFRFRTTRMASIAHRSPQLQRCGQCASYTGLLATR